MVEERSLRAHLLAIRALLAATQERCSSLMRDICEGRADAHDSVSEFEELCSAVNDLAAQCERMESLIRRREQD